MSTGTLRRHRRIVEVEPKRTVVVDLEPTTVKPVVVGDKKKVSKKSE